MEASTCTKLKALRIVLSILVLFGLVIFGIWQYFDAKSYNLRQCVKYAEECRSDLIMCLNEPNNPYLTIIKAKYNLTDISNHT